jgi:hypothetical protein
MTTNRTVAATSADGAWRGADQSAANSDEPISAASGKSVYGNGVGLIHHSSEAQSYSAELPPMEANESPRGSATPDAQRQVILEWNRR